MNKYLNLNRVEFLITGNCSSNCKHCSNNSIDRKSHLSLEKGKFILNQINNEYQLNSIMVFGGEPLLYPEVSIPLLKYAKELKIEDRQIITNGFWSKNKTRIDEICLMLKDADINNILVSIDGFHEEYLDYEIVEYTVSQLSKLKLPNISLHPCWYISPEDNNRYDIKTRKLLDQFHKYGITISSGNILFPAGKSVESFPDRFKTLDNIEDINCGNLPYTESPKLLKSVGIDPNGKVSSLCFGHNMEINEFLESYNPYSDDIMSLFLDQGILGLKELADKKDISFDILDYYSICDACSDLRSKLGLVI